MVAVTCEDVETVRRRPNTPRRRVDVVAVVVVVGETVVVVPFPRRRMIPASTSAIVAKQHKPATAHINPYFQFRCI
jgi:hypothetical protein